MKWIAINERQSSAVSPGRMVATPAGGKRLKRKSDAIAVAIESEEEDVPMEDPESDVHFFKL